MQQVALGWLVYRLTDSALLLGVIGFCGQFPGFVTTLFAGAFADRWDRYRMLLVAQVLYLVQAALLAALVLTGEVRIWHVVVLSVAAGLINGLDIPVRQALLVRFVGGAEDLPNAIALNSSMFNAARLVGPAVAGLLIGWLGEGPVFAINALSRVAVVWALVAIHLPGERGEPTGGVLSSIREGFGYAFGFAPIRDMLIVLGVVSLVGVPYVVLLPVFAGGVLGGDARTLGLLTSCAGLGALLGALWLAARDTLLGLGHVVARATAACALVVFALSRSLWIACPALVVVGGAVMLTTASSNTVIQTLVSERMRGRVMSLYALSFVGVTPIGSLAGGAIAESFGGPLTVAVGGIGCLALAFWFGRRLEPLRAEVLPAYARLGVLPEVARGLESATELRPKT
jgi:MFS family permease